MSHLGSQVDKNSTEHTLQIKHVEGDYSTNIQNLDSKTRSVSCFRVKFCIPIYHRATEIINVSIFLIVLRSLIEETRNTMNTYKLIEENERDKLESRLSSHIDRVVSQREAKWVRISSIACKIIVPF